MSAAKQRPEATNLLSFLQNTPASFHESEQKVYDSRIQTDNPRFNDSNSDDTQFEILNSNDASPVKDNILSEQIRHEDDTERKNKYIRPVCALYDQEEPEANEKILPQKQSASLNDTDASSFVDYFLAHDDLLQALDDYSRSVGEPSVFPLEMAPELSTSQAKHFSSSDVCTPSSTIETSDINMSQTNSIATNNEQSHSGVKSDIPPQTECCEKETESLKHPRGKDSLITKQPRSKTTRRSEKRKPRTYSHAIPSQHCHICSRRPTETSPHAVCGNLLKGRCRKTICTKCFHQFRWDLKAAREAPPGTWECPHCRGECPQRAQCVIYNRTSDRRRMKLINHRKKKEQSKASAMRKDRLNSKACRKTESRTDSPDSGTTTMNPFAVVNSCSSLEIMRPAPSPSKSEKKCLQSSGISKPVRTSGISTYAQFVDMGDEIIDKVISEGKLPSGWDGSELLAGTEVPLPELGPKSTDFDRVDEVEAKREAGMLQDNILDADGGNECEDITGILSCMGYGGEPKVEGVVEEKETRMEVDTSLGLLDMKEPFESNNQESESDQEKLELWGDDEVKCEETEMEAFALNSTALDLNSLG